jgi:amino acid adenylation domain-containing protein
MALWDGYETASFRVVVNARGQLSVWPAERILPPGWGETGVCGALSECLSEIDKGIAIQNSALVAAPASVSPVSPGRAVLRGAARPVPEVPITTLIRRQDLPAESTAIRDGTREVTRAELLHTSRAWAAVLAAEGCAGGSPVVLALPRSADALIAIVAVLEAGGAYVPLPPDAPTARVKSVIRDCQPQIAITTPEFADRFRPDVKSVLTVGDLERRAGQPTESLPGVSSESLAFIFYTSGTSGEPKGVEGTHAQLVNYALWCRDTFPHHPGEVMFLTAALYFLGSLTTIFTPLLAGWPIAVAPDEATADAVLEMTQGFQGGLVKLTPTHLRMMTLRGVPRSGLARQLMIGSEPLTFTSELREWLRADPHRTAVNHYGLTETHGCLCHRLSGLEEPGSRIPVGIPVDNAEAYIVNRHGELALIGEVGELLVGGPSIGRGYHRRPSLTATRWIPHPWGAPGDRLLRTGDLARLEADGIITLLGRADRQVKIRGHRVEPTAIEELLRAVPHVKEALVLPRQLDGEIVLSAYLLRDGDMEISPAAVSSELEDSLPTEWIPTRIAVLDEFPVTGHGKVDTASLPLPPPVRRSSRPDHQGSRWSRTELIVGSTYCAVLGVGGVGLGDDFFELSGSSLAAVEAAGRIGQLLGCDVPAPSSAAASVREYARQIDGQRTDNTRDRGAR